MLLHVCAGRLRRWKRAVSLLLRPLLRQLRRQHEHLQLHPPSRAASPCLPVRSAAPAAWTAPVSEARFAGPQGLAVDAAGNLFVADAPDKRIRKVTRAGGGVLTRLISNDLPKSRLLALLLAALVLGLLFAPFLFPGVKALSVAAKILIFIVLAASFDLLLGYTGIVSFAHTMFFGIGAYGIAIASTRLGATWSALAVGTLVALGVSFVLALLIGLFSLRVRAIFFAMITLAVASAFQTLASQLSQFTGGEDGLSFRLPALLSPSFEFSEEPFLGVSLDGRLLSYYLLFIVAVLLVLALLRIVNSPFGRVLQAIRENEFRAEAIGYRVVVYRTTSNILAALFATFAGAMLAVWLRYNGPATSLSFEIMLDVLLIVVIGGMGTIWGAVIGAALFVIAQSYLQDLLKIGSDAAAGSLPWLGVLLSPDRWLLWLGVLFVLSVYFFPTGVVGRLRAGAARSVKRIEPGRP